MTLVWPDSGAVSYLLSLSQNGPWFSVPTYNNRTYNLLSKWLSINFDPRVSIDNFISLKCDIF